jgi:hypothetical protein
VPQLAEASARHERPDQHAGRHRAPSGTERRRPDFQEEKGAGPKNAEKAPTQAQKTEKSISCEPQVALSC